MPKPLVIVESPAKARTISRFLGPDYDVESSIGHIRDLPRSAADIPPAYKSEPWARLGVDVDNDFKPLYVVSPERREQVRKLKKMVKDASELYLATDEDREGESIAWHLLEVLAPTVPVKRMVFHEITQPAIQRAVRDWRELDRRLVDAQETRRILDRLYGYEVSPVLWKKIMPSLSAGRVQSVATRLVVERERARMRFRSASYWDLTGVFLGGEPPESFGASLVELDGKRLASGRDFDESGGLTRSDVILLDSARAAELAARLRDASFGVRSVEEKPWRRSPHAPFMTSTLQQEASRKLRFPAARTMRVAQELYESGHITYMRTDSTTLSSEALEAARSQARALYGDDYVPSSPRRYDKKVKNAQEAHEAIRPAGEAFKTPEQTGLSGDARRLYELIWMRTVASQMADAVGRSVSVRLGAISSSGEDAVFATSGRVITFPGFLRAYVEGSDDPDSELEDREVRLPALDVGDSVALDSLQDEEHQTAPPARYSEASLVKALEDMGVGRPSTYASILETIQNRGYVWKKGSALVPSWTAFAVVGLLERHFSGLVDYGFTASMEEDLDEIANGARDAIPWLTRFYFGSLRDTTGDSKLGDSEPGLKKLVLENLGEIDAREVNSIPVGGPDSGIVVRVGRYGPYIQREVPPGEAGPGPVSPAGDPGSMPQSFGQRAPLPEDLAPDELTVAKALELLEAGSSERELGVNPQTGLAVYVKTGRFGPYVQEGEPSEEPTSKAAGSKPRTASLLRGMDPQTITLHEALRLLSLPRLVGVDPDSGEPIEATNGRYGPYLKKGSDSRSLDSEEKLFTVTLEEALELFSRPKERRGRAAAAAPLRELGPDPASGVTILVKDGRFGPYVTDGTTNASLRKGDTVDGITTERAAELLSDRRSAPPRPGRPAGGRKKAGPAKRAVPAKKVVPAKKATSASKASATANKTTGAKKATTANKAAGAKKAGG
jgi:DNA topoisomerase-1